jgi:hypothetical protein
LALLYPTEKGVHKFWHKKWRGQHFGRVFHKLIWSPWTGRFWISSLFVRREKMFLPFQEKINAKGFQLLNPNAQSFSTFRPHQAG